MSQSILQKPILNQDRLRATDTQTVEVTVCIANWNCCDYLRACLQSLLHQPQGVSLEIIVVDNASQDGAVEMVRDEFPEVKLIENRENLGFARANNQGARIAQGRYLFFLNNDTVVEPYTLQLLRDYAEEHPEVGALGPRLRDGHGHIQSSSRSAPTIGALLHKTMLFRWTGLFKRAYKKYRGRLPQGEQPISTEVLMGAALFLPRQLFDDIGGWSEDHTFGGEDIELCTRIRRSHQVVHLPQVEITHFGRVSSRQNIGYAYRNTFIGIAQCLRSNGTSSLAILGYKVVVTLDAPLRCLALLGQYLLRKVQGKRKAASQSLLALKGVASFLIRGLLKFWQI